MTRLLKHLYPVLLAVGVVAIYAQTHAFELINLDDLIYADRHGPVGEGLSRANLAWAFSREAAARASCWFPLTHLSYMASFSCLGGSAGTLHLENAALHVVATVLVYALLLALLAPVRAGRRDAAMAFCAFAAAAFWGWHPLRVEAVAWVASRKDLLSTPLYVLGLLLSLRAGESGRDRWAKAAVPAVFVLALLAKPTAVSFPFMALAATWIQRGRIRTEGLALLLGLAAAGCVMAYWGQDQGGALSDLPDVTLFQRAVNAVAAIGAYVRQTVVPVGMGVPYCFLWPVNRLDLGLGAGAVVGAIAALGGTLAGAAACFRGGARPLDAVAAYGGALAPSTRVVQGALLWMGITLLPMLGIVGFGYHARADRFTYLPAIGVSLLLALGLSRLLGGLAGRRWRGALAAGVCLALAALGGAAFRQTAHWASDYTLFRHSAAVTDGNWQAHALIGGYLLGTRGDPGEAEAEYRRSIAIRESPEIRAQLAMVGFVNGEAAWVEEQLELARERQRDPAFGALYSYCIGLKSLLDGDLDIAEARLWDARRENVNAELIAYPMARIYERRGDGERAALFFSMAARSPLFRWLGETYSMTQAEIDAAVKRLFGKQGARECALSPTGRLQ